MAPWKTSVLPHFEKIFINPDQIEQMFDEITYEKGASVMRMLEQFVGDVKFRNWIRQYIKSNEYGNATGENLWSAISAQCGKDVSEIMHTWVYQEGYPLVSLASVDPTNAKMDISQKRFTFKRSQQSATAQTIWDIPLTVRSLDDSGTRRILTIASRFQNEVVGPHRPVVLKHKPNFCALHLRPFR